MGHEGPRTEWCNSEIKQFIGYDKDEGCLQQFESRSVEECQGQGLIQKDEKFGFLSMDLFFYEFIFWRKLKYKLSLLVFFNYVAS